MTKTKLYCLAVLTASSLTASADKIAFNGNLYEYIEGIPNIEGKLLPVTWSAAKAHAESLGGYLVSITSAEENAFLVSSFPAAVLGGAWLGGFQPAGSTEPDGGWSWVSGEPWSYANWASAEPNDTIGWEQALQFDVWTDKGGTWNDQSGNDNRGFIVEYPGTPGVPETATTALLLALGLCGCAVARRTNSLPRTK